MLWGLDKYFLYPYALFAILLVPALLFVCEFLAARRRKAVRRFMTDAPNPLLRRFQLPLTGLGLILVLLAAARPRWGKISERVPVTDRNVVVALDVSRSMLARDVRPNRLERAKSDIVDLIDSLDGDRCALVAFRRSAVALSPLTTDEGFLRDALKSVSSVSAPAGETNIGGAIKTSLKLISQMDGKDGATARSSAIVIISDGGDLKGTVLDEAREAKKRGVPIFTIGIGDPENPSPVFDDEGDYVMYEGEKVMTRLEEECLREVADVSGGRYVPLATAATAKTTLGDIYRNLLSQIETQNKEDEMDVLAEKYVLFLVPGILFLLAAAMLSKGRPRGRKKTAKAVLLFFPLLPFVTFATDGSFKIMTYNVRHGETSDKGFDLARCAAVISAENPRFAALQEVDMCTGRIGRTNTCAELEKIFREKQLCITNWNFSKAIKFDGGEYGVALFSREKPLRVDTVKLGGEEPRVLLMCEFEDCWVGVTHLPLRFAPQKNMKFAPHFPSLPFSDVDVEIVDENIALAEKKMRLACEYNRVSRDFLASVLKIEVLARAKTKPVFLTGDWNAQPNSRFVGQIKEFMSILTPEDAFTFHGVLKKYPSEIKGKCIDYIAVDAAHEKSYEVLSRRVIEERIVSDHAPVVVEINPITAL